MTIAGSNFGSTKGTSTVTFNGTGATPSSWSATSIVVPVPAGATTGNVVVTVGGVASHRADVTILECAKALAALAGRSEVTPDEILDAAGLALGHRLPFDPFAPAPKLEPQQLRRLLEEALDTEVAPRKKAPGTAA